MKTILIVIAILALLVLAIGLIRVGGGLEYSAEGIRAWLRFGPLTLQVYPRKPQKAQTKDKASKKTSKKKKKKKKTSKKRSNFGKKPKKKQAATQKLGGSISLLKELLPIGIELLGALKQTLLIEELTLHYTIPGRDEPAHAALLYGQLCAGGGVITALLEEHFTIRSRRISAWVDFTAKEALVYARLSLSYTIGQFTHMGLSIGIKVLRILIKRRKATTGSAESGSAPKKTGGQ